MSQLFVDNIKNRTGGAIGAPSGAVVTGIVTATTFDGNITGVAATFTGNVTVGGVLTYEDVTNIDSVGLITARSGIKFGVSGVGGTITATGQAEFAGVCTAASFSGAFSGDLSIDDKIIHTGDTNTAIRFPAADTFSVETAGTARLQIDSTGNTKASGTVWGGTIDGGVTATTSYASRLYNNSAFPTLYAKNSGNGGLWQGVNSSGTQTSKINSDGSAEFAATISDSIGPLRRLGVNSQSGAYTLVVADAGKAVTQSTNSAAVTVPASTFTAGDMVTVINNTGTNINLTQGSGLTMYNSADAATGTRTLAQRGAATLLFISASVAYVSGSGLS